MTETTQHEIWCGDQLAACDAARPPEMFAHGVMDVLLLSGPLSRVGWLAAAGYLELAERPILIEFNCAAQSLAGWSDFRESLYKLRRVRRLPVAILLHSAFGMGPMLGSWCDVIYAVPLTRFGYFGHWRTDGELISYAARVGPSNFGRELGDNAISATYTYAQRDMSAERGEAMGLIDLLACCDLCVIQNFDDITSRNPRR